MPFFSAARNSRGEDEKKVKKRGCMKTLLPYFKPYKKECFLAPLFKLFEAIFELLVPVVVAKVVDVGLGTVLPGGGYAANNAYIVKMAMLLIGLGFVGLLCAVIAQYFAAKAATGVSYRLRGALFSKLQTLSYADYDKLGTSAMLNRMTGDVQQFQTGINMFLRLFLRSPLIVFGALIVALTIDPHAALVFAAVIPALFLAVALIMGAATPLHKKAQEKSDKVVLSVRENLTGVRVVRAFCKEEQDRKDFRKKNLALTKGREKAGVVGALMNPVTFVLVNVAVIFLLKVGAIRVDGGARTQGDVIALYNLMSQILVELVKFANLVVTVTKAAACGERIEGVLKTQSSLKKVGENEPNAVTTKQGYIVFDGVTLRYPSGAAAAVKNASFSVNKGDVVGVIGGTGSGKSSLVSLLPHFYDATEGGVYLNGKNVAAYDEATLRQKIAVVQQKSVLFKGTIRSNLSWGNADAANDDALALSAVKAAQAEDVVKAKGGLDAEIEQGGGNLSGGQKQRLCIARALLKDAEVLILDDCSSALDYATERSLMNAIRERQQQSKQTVFIVSQRASALSFADKILVMDDGEIVNVGTHEELLKSSEIYRDIYEFQYGKIDDAADTTSAADAVSVENAAENAAESTAQTAAENTAAKNERKEGGDAL